MRKYTIFQINKDIAKLVILVKESDSLSMGIRLFCMREE